VLAKYSCNINKENPRLRLRENFICKLERGHLKIQDLWNRPYCHG
jgi:hypothetical protein